MVRGGGSGRADLLRVPVTVRADLLRAPRHRPPYGSGSRAAAQAGRADGPEACLLYTSRCR
ncbi:hypothetical protein EF908_23855, partial [Streptomyces sp. WAC04770]